MAFLISGVPGNSAASAIAMVGIMRLSTLWYGAALGLPFSCTFRVGMGASVEWYGDRATRDARYMN